MGCKYCDNCGEFVYTIEEKTISTGSYDFGNKYTKEYCIKCNQKLSSIQTYPEQYTFNLFPESRIKIDEVKYP